MSQSEVFGQCAVGVPLPLSEVLIFTLDDHRYGLSTAGVQELIRAVPSVPVAHPLDGIEGVIDLHGQIVPVIDLRHRLGLAAKAPQPTDHMIIVRIDRRLVAIRVDRVTEVCRIEPEMVQAMPDALDGAGIIRMPDGLAMVLDTARLDVPTLAASSRNERLARDEHLDGAAPPAGTR